ncbi:acyl-CoA dehydrogenase family protein, partial [bacterium]|nr:acyl-CoA dehydrogenase family protein [bacterium]
MFEFTKPQKEIRKAARDFAKGEFDKELAYEMDKAGTFPKKIWEKAADLGFIGIHFPEAYSGGEMGMLESVLIAEEFCRKDSSIGAALTLSSFASECLLNFGDDEMKRQYLPRIAAGEMLSTGAFSETDYGFDFSDISTMAIRQGEEWVINGTKKHVINGGQAGIYIVLCRTDMSNDPSDNRYSLILVEKGCAGITTKDIGPKLGCKLTATADLTFTDVRVPATSLLGKEGKGLSQLKAFLAEDRIMTAAQALGNAMGSMDRVLDYTKGRVQFGKKLAEFQISRHKIADMAVKIEMAGLMTYKAAWSRDNGHLDDRLASMAKMAACRAAMEVGAQT